MASFRVDKVKLYSDLGITFDADLAIIKSSYKKKALECHPDRHVNATAAEQAKHAATFQEVSLAFEVLSDATKKVAYDSGGMPAVTALEMSAEGEGSGGDSATQPSEHAAAETAKRAARARAYETYKSAFGHNPVFDVDPDTGAAVPVHNMAAQRGGSSFDDVQRSRLDDMFSGMSVGGGSSSSSSHSSGSTRSSSSSTKGRSSSSHGLFADIFRSGSNGGSSGEDGGGSYKGGGRYSGQGWHH